MFKRAVEKLAMYEPEVAKGLREEWEGRDDETMKESVVLLRYRKGRGSVEKEG